MDDIKKKLCKFQENLTTVAGCITETINLSFQFQPFSKAKQGIHKVKVCQQTHKHTDYRTN